LLVGALVATSCSEAPTEPQIDCTTVALGEPLSHVVTSAAALRPALEDARDRIVPVFAALPALVAQLEAAVGAADRVAACSAFNATVDAFNTLVASASDERAPEIETLRLTLQFARTWIVSS
jgi:ABC-type transporter Mla subunit MlaD